MTGTIDNTLGQLDIHLPPLQIRVDIDSRSIVISPPAATGRPTVHRWEVAPGVWHHLDSDGRLLAVVVMEACFR